MSESKLQQPSDLADMGKPELLIQMFEIFSLSNLPSNYASF